MYAHTVLEKYRIDKDGTTLQIKIPDINLQQFIAEKAPKYAEIRIDDGRCITSLQRKKAYATIRDISSWTGYLPEEQKEWLKYLYIERTGSPYFSLSDCSMDTAREFINVILDYALEEGIPLSEMGVERTDDIGRYLYSCIKNRRCAVCGRPGEIHHVDTIGMGRDRRHVDDSMCKKICLCREHHTAAHQRGMKAFEQMYHVFGIVVRETITTQVIDKWG